MTALHPSAAPLLEVAAVQYKALDGGVAANAAEHVRIIEDAESHGVRLVLFPELSLTGYDLRLFEDPSNWLSDGHSHLAEIMEICRRTGITAVVGAAWRDAEGLPRLVSLAIHPGGRTIPMLKTHLHGKEEELFEPGAGPVLLELDGWNIAFAVCADAAHPDHAATAARLGADVYAVSALYVEGEEERLEDHLGARAADNGIYSVLANLAGSTQLGTSCGLSGAWGPDGGRIAGLPGSKAGIVVARLPRREEQPPPLG